MKKVFVCLLPALLSFSAVQLSAQNVGIGTATPNTTARLHIDVGSSANGLLVTGIAGQSDAIPDLGAGRRMMFYPGKSAFRAGTCTGLEWNNSNTGRYSAAFGYGTKASGLYSFAAGYLAQAAGEASLSIGSATMATGNNSAAFGLATSASGNRSTALGFNTVAQGTASTAMGSLTTATGPNSTAMGFYTSATGSNSTAMGDNTFTQGIASFSTGFYTIARSVASVAMGRYNEAFTGSSTTNWVSTDPLLILGNGESDISRSNAMVVYKNGNMEINGFTRLGGVNDKGVGAPAIKMKEFFENTATTQGSWRDVAHGLATSKILSVSILVDASPAFAVQAPPFYSYYPGYEYQYHISATNIVIINSANNSFNILNKPMKILVTYKE